MHLGDDHILMHVQTTGPLHNPLHDLTSRVRVARKGLTSQSLKITLKAAVHGTQDSHVWLSNDLVRAKTRRRRPDGTSKFSRSHADWACQVNGVTGSCGVTSVRRTGVR
jgi:hypothetical protein